MHEDHDVSSHSRRKDTLSAEDLGILLQWHWKYGHGYLRERTSASARRSLALNSHCLLRATQISHKQQSKNVHSPYPGIFVSEAGGEWEGVPSYVFTASCPASGNPSEICCKLTAFRCQPSRASPAKQGENQEYIDLFSLSRQSLQNKQCFHN
jgi:hypothetical protein